LRQTHAAILILTASPATVSTKVQPTRPGLRLAINLLNRRRSRPRGRSVLKAIKGSTHLDSKRRIFLNHRSPKLSNASLKLMISRAQPLHNVLLDILRPQSRQNVWDGRRRPRYQAARGHTACRLIRSRAAKAHNVA
jgi:hypothetical protein